MKRYESKNIIVQSYKRGGYFILRIMNYNASLVATKHSTQAHIEEGWGCPYEKKFEEKEGANRYFTAIKRSHPDLHIVSDEPNKYISHDGTVKTY